MGKISRVAFWIPTPKLRLETNESHAPRGFGAFRPTWRYGVSGSTSTARPVLVTQCVATRVLIPFGPLSNG